MRARNNEEQQELSEDHQNETDEKIGVYRKYFEPAETVSSFLLGTAQIMDVPLES